MLTLHRSEGLPRLPVFERESEIGEESIGLKIRAGFDQKHISFYDEAAGVGVRIGLITAEGDFYSPRHRHTFVNLRYLIRGRIAYGDEIYGEGDLIYVPESVRYGPMQPAAKARHGNVSGALNGVDGATWIDMQFMGPSGIRYFRPEELQHAQAELSKRGKFITGVYREDGRNLDSYEACHQFLTGSLPQYPPPRQTTYTVVHSANVPWKPFEGSSSVSVKHLGYFTEDGPNVKLVQMSAGASTKPGFAPYQQARFVLSGSVLHDGREFAATSFAYYPPNADYGETRATSDTTVLVVQWATLKGQPPEYCAL